MKHLKSFFVVLLLSFCSNSYANFIGPENLGVWQMITVDMVNDPEIDGYLVYEIDEPSDEIGTYGVEGQFFGLNNSYMHYNLYGCGQPYLSKESGVVLLHLRKRFLEADSFGEDCQLTIELPVKRRVNGRQAFYILQLNLTYNRIVP